MFQRALASVAIAAESRGILAAVFVTLLALSALGVGAADDSPSDAERLQQDNCSSVTVQDAGMRRDLLRHGWNLAEDGTLSRPGCESAH